MNENGNKKTIPEIFTVLYFADIATSMAAAIMWGNFPATSVFMTPLINSILIWIMFKIMVYVIIMAVFRWVSKHSNVADNILISVTVIYAVLVMNNLASVTMTIPAFNIDPSFYDSINKSAITVIP